MAIGARCGLALALVLLSARPVLAVNEPLKGPPIVGKDEYTKIPFLSADMRGQYAMPAISTQMRVIRVATGQAWGSIGNNLGTGGYQDSNDTQFHNVKAPANGGLGLNGFGGVLDQWPTAVWHSGPSQTVFPDGEYLVEFSWCYVSQYPNGPFVVAGSVPVNVVNGVFTEGEGLNQPPFEQQQEGTGRIRVVVKHLGVAQAGYRVTVPGGMDNGSPAVATTDSTGTASFEVKPGTYPVEASGMAQGATLGDSGVRNALVLRNGFVSLVFDFDQNGKDSNGSGGVPGASDPTSGTGGWMSDLVLGLLKPSNAAIDNLKSKALNLLDFGPFALAKAFWFSSGQQASGQVALSLPIMAPSSSGVWAATGTSIPLGYSGLTSAPLWPVVRALLGAGVWFAFMIYLLKRLTPYFSL